MAAIHDHRRDVARQSGASRCAPSRVDLIVAELIPSTLLKIPDSFLAAFTEIVSLRV